MLNHGWNLHGGGNESCCGLSERIFSPQGLKIGAPEGEWRPYAKVRNPTNVAREGVSRAGVNQRAESK